MTILIDGYNLLHASGIFPRGVGPSTLERSRGALLNFLAESLEPDELAHTIVVFDAAAAPPGLPRAVEHKGLAVRFAPSSGSADELIEELILADHAPKRLTVVSSDHRLHRAALRRKATPIDSDRWFADLMRRRMAAPDIAATSTKPAAPASEEEVNLWLRRFGLEEDGAVNKGEANRVDDDSSSIHPFPPGYADDGAPFRGACPRCGANLPPEGGA